MARLQALLNEASTQGARVVDVTPPAASSAEPTSRQMNPTLVFNPGPGLKLLDEEIFGPILPVVAYDSLDEAIRYINARPRPLALYWFGTDTAARDQVMAEHGERRREHQRHAHARGPRRPAVRRCGRERLGRLPR